MIDIFIVKRRDRAHIYGESPIGCKWLNNNLIGVQNCFISVQADTIEETINKMEAEGLIVEFK